MGNSKQMVI